MGSNSENYNTDQSNPDGRSQSQRNEQYKFSAEEMRVLKQCNTESFYQRSLPFGTVFGVATYYAVKSGHLTTHTRFGAMPKVAVAVISGYFLGKLSYQAKCAEKLMALPNSQIGELLRQRKRQGGGDSITFDHGFSAPIGIESEAPPAAPMQSHLNIDSDRPYVSDYDKHSHDDVQFDLSEIPVPPAGSSPTSYDELRKQNREVYDNQRNKPYKPAGEIEETPPVVRAPSRQREYSPSVVKPKNKYGDIWDQ